MRRNSMRGRRYLPELRLGPPGYMAGIRPNWVKGDELHDFIIREESDRGLTGSSTSSASNRLAHAALAIGLRQQPLG
jgi:hypothetical protein